MSNLEMYKEIFKKVFSISDEMVESLTFQGIEQWDSVGHMELISEIEDTFGIMIDTDDIIDFSSFEKGKEILSKYEIQF